jgi:hypothetical protein
MYCPQCRVEYRSGFTQCADCSVALLPGAPPPEPEDESPAAPPEELSVDDLVTVLETSEPVQIALAKGLLEDAAIPYCLGPSAFPLSGRHAGHGLDGGAFGWGWTCIRVAHGRAVEARELVAPLLEPLADPSPEEPENGEAK